VIFINYKDYINLEVYGSSKNFFQKLYARYFLPQTNAVFLIRTFQRYSAKKNKLANIVSKYYKLKLAKYYGIYIGQNTKIGIGLSLPHPNGIIFGDGVVIGNNVTIYQQVTFGVARREDSPAGKYPIIGDDCIFFAGAKVIGNIKIGSNVIVGANCVLNSNADDDSIYVGVPGKKIKK